MTKARECGKQQTDAAFHAAVEKATSRATQQHTIRFTETVHTAHQKYKYPVDQNGRSETTNSLMTLMKREGFDDDKLT